MNGTTVFLFFGVGAAVMVAGQLLGPRSDLVRRTMRSVYTNSGLLFFLRATVGVYPLLAVGCALFAIGTLPPRPIGAWLAVGGVAFEIAGFVASYLVPPPFMPRWLRNEIDQGLVPLLRPSRWDWLFVLGLGVLIGILVVSGFLVIVVDQGCGLKSC